MHCDKLLIIFSTPRKLTRLGDVTLGPRLGSLTPSCSPAPSRHGPLGGPQLRRALWLVRRWTGLAPPPGRTVATGQAGFFSQEADQWEPQTPGQGRPFLLIHIDCPLLCLPVCIWLLSVLVMESLAPTPDDQRGGSEASVWLGWGGVGLKEQPDTGCFTSQTLLEKGHLNVLYLLYLLKL